MATRKASDSNLTGKKYNDASAGASKIVDLPENPTITSITGAANPDVNFTAPLRGGTPTNYSGETVPATNTRTSSSSPMTFSGLTPGSVYTFKIKSVNGVGESPYSAESSSVTITGWSLSQTFTSSGTYTIPTGATQIGVVVISGGSSGGGAANDFGGGGGGSGSAVGFWGYGVTPGDTHVVTVGGTSGTSNFGNIASAVSGGNANANYATNRQIANAVGGGGAGGYQGANGGPGASSSPANITLNIPTNGPYNHPHGGGGGGGAWFGGSPGGGGASCGGGGGGGGNGPGGGGGGGGRVHAGHFTYNYGAGGGAAGRVYVYAYVP